MPATGSWKADGPWVIEKLEDMDTCITGIDAKLDATREDIAELKGASRLSGGVWGGIAAVAVAVIQAFVRSN